MKRKVFLTDDMKAKVLYEANRDGVKAAAARYNVTASSVSKWRKLGIQPSNGASNGGSSSSDDALHVLLQLVYDHKIDVAEAGKVIARLK